MLTYTIFAGKLPRPFHLGLPHPQMPAAVAETFDNLYLLNVTCIPFCRHCPPSTTLSVWFLGFPGMLDLARGQQVSKQISDMSWFDRHHAAPLRAVVDYHVQVPGTSFSIWR